MKATLDTTLGTILDDPEAKAVLEQYVPGVADNPMIAMAKGWTLRAIVSMPIAAQFGLTEEVANNLLAEINKQL